MVFFHGEIMKIIRSTIAASEIHQLIQDHYNDFSADTICLFEYRGLNDIYKFISGKSLYFFKIFAREDIDQQAIMAEVEIVNYLKNSGLSVAYPIPLKDGEFLLPIITPERTRFGVMFTAAEGFPIHYDTLNESEMINISHLISNMHSILDGIPTSPQRWKLDEHLFLDHSLELLAEYSQINPQVDLPFL